MSKEETIKIHITNREAFYLIRNAATGGFITEKTQDALLQHDMLKQFGVLDDYFMSASGVDLGREALDPTIVREVEISSAAVGFFLKRWTMRMGSEVALNLASLIQRLEDEKEGNYQMPSIVNGRIVQAEATA